MGFSRFGIRKWEDLGSGNGRVKCFQGKPSILDFLEAENQVLEKQKSVQNGKRILESLRAIF